MEQNLVYVLTRDIVSRNSKMILQVCGCQDFADGFNPSSRLQAPAVLSNTGSILKNYSPPWSPPWLAGIIRASTAIFISRYGLFPCPCLILCSFPIAVVSLKPDYLLNMVRNPLNPTLNLPLLQLIPNLKPCSLCLQPPDWNTLFGGMPLHK
jgi:hypothetical protein